METSVMMGNYLFQSAPGLAARGNGTLLGLRDYDDNALSEVQDAIAFAVEHPDLDRRSRGISRRRQRGRPHMLVHDDARHFVLEREHGYPTMSVISCWIAAATVAGLALARADASEMTSPTRASQLTVPSEVPPAASGGNTDSIA